jgi:O-Antigen ligase
LTAGRPLPVGLAAATGAVVGAALLAGSGSSSGRLFWIGGGAVLVAALGLAAVYAGLFGVRPVLTRAGVVFVSLLTGLALWSALSIHWSIQPGRSWDYTNRGVAYLAFAICGVLLGAVIPRAPTAVAAGLTGLLGAVVTWALAGKVFPGVEPDYGHIARLRTPVGYWNALALLLVVALPLALWAASRRGAPAWARGLGAVLGYGVLVALPLTYSRGGLAIAAALVVAWVALADERLEGLATLAICGVPAGATVGLAFALRGVTDDGQTLSVRRYDGAIFGGVVLAGAVVVWILAVLAVRAEARLSPERRRSFTRVGIALLALLLVAGVIAYAVATGPTAWVHQFRNDVAIQNTEAPSRLVSLSSSNRWFWWQEAWHSFLDHPLNGTGAGTFELTHRLLRNNALDATEPHELPLQFMTETGIVGFLLAAGAALAALFGFWRVLGRRDAERPARLALALGPPAYLAYALVDFDWDFVAVTGPMLLVTGLLLTAGAREVRRRPVLALGVLVAAAACIYSLAAPWLAARRIDQVYAAIDSNPQHAVALALSAHRLNPLAFEPLVALSDAAESAGNLGGAWGALTRATQIQPHNWEPWYDLGVFELEVLNKPCAAYFDLNRSWSLDALGLPGEHGGPLDRARIRVNHGACPDS